MRSVQKQHQQVKVWSPWNVVTICEINGFQKPFIQSPRAFHLYISACIWLERPKSHLKHFRHKLWINFSQIQKRVKGRSSLKSVWDSGLETHFCTCCIWKDQIISLELQSQFIFYWECLQQSKTFNLSSTGVCKSSAWKPFTSARASQLEKSIGFSGWNFQGFCREIIG